MKTPRFFVGLLALVVVLAVAGCGGSSVTGGGPATLVPKHAPLYLEVDLAPSATTGKELDELAGLAFGVDDVEGFIAEELEKVALAPAEEVDLGKEVRPLLGNKAGVYETAGGDGRNGIGMAIETNDSGEAEEFLAGRLGKTDQVAEFEGSKFYEAKGGSAVGVIGDYIALGRTRSDFKEMVEASRGEGLGESTKFRDAMEGASDEGLGRVYVDVGRASEELKGSFPLELQPLLGLAGVEPREATAVATIVPHSEQVEIDISVGSDNVAAVSGDASGLLESMPAGIIAGFASANLGPTLGSAIDEVNREGIPGQIKPGLLGAALEGVGINLESITESVGDVGGFVEGRSEGFLGGALVIEMGNVSEARRTVSHLESLLQATDANGVESIAGAVNGFSVRSSDFGRQPLFVGTVGRKIAFSNELGAAHKALVDEGPTLGSIADFKTGKGALAPTPIVAFVDGSATLSMIEASLRPDERAEFDEARPLLQKISYLAIGVGSEAEGDTQTAKLIIGLTK